MEFRVTVTRDADAELGQVPGFYRRAIVATIMALLTTEPCRESKSRIKRLRQPAGSVYRLRVGEYRVFYDVDGSRVNILAVRHRSNCVDLYGGSARES
jgi:mRNA-degrading endonuclease RelE of RelBE toxin-antitoxin system